MVCSPNLRRYEENLTAHEKKVSHEVCLYILYQILYIIPKRGKRKITKSTLANISDKMFTERTNQIIRTQINIPFQFLIYTYFCLGWIENKNLPQMPLPNACACIRACYRWPRLTGLSNGTWKHPNTNLKQVTAFRKDHLTKQKKKQRKSRSWEKEVIRESIFNFTAALLVH